MRKLLKITGSGLKMFDKGTFFIGEYDKYDNLNKIVKLVIFKHLLYCYESIFYGKIIKIYNAGMFFLM
jgi:hypothetical protein